MGSDGADLPREETYAVPSQPNYQRAKNLTVPAFTPEVGEMTLDPKVAKSKTTIVSNCGKLGTPTICDKNLRTVNTQAECLSPEDIYQQVKQAFSC